PRDDRRYQSLAARLERLAESSVASTVPPDRREAAREAAAKPPKEELAVPIKQLIGAPDPLPPHAEVRIALIGTPWPQVLKSARTKIYRAGSNQDETLSDYTTRVVQAARMVAPDATYGFVGLPSTDATFQTSELLRAFADITNSDADVLLFTFGGAA